MNETCCRNCFMELDCGQVEFCSTDCREIFEETMRETTNIETIDEGNNE